MYAKYTFESFLEVVSITHIPILPWFYWLILLITLLFFSNGKSIGSPFNRFLFGDLHLLLVSQPISHTHIYPLFAWCTCRIVGCWFTVCVMTVTTRFKPICGAMLSPNGLVLPLWSAWQYQLVTTFRLLDRPHQHVLPVVNTLFWIIIPHSNHITYSDLAAILICHITMCRDSMNFLYISGHVVLWCFN